MPIFMDRHYVEGASKDVIELKGFDQAVEVYEVSWGQ